MFQSSCFQLQVIGQGAATRSNLALCLTFPKRCSVSSLKSPTLLIGSSQYWSFNHNQVARNRRWNLDHCPCPPNSSNGFDLHREKFVSNKELHLISRPLMQSKLHRSIFSLASLGEKQQGADSAKEKEEQLSPILEEPGQNNGAWKEEDYPLGEYEYKKIEGWRRVIVRLKMLIALPWERVKKGSVLNMKLRGQIADQLQGRFSSRLSLPQICQNFIKAAHDPRIAGIYLQIEPLDCGWGKIDEIRRHILDYRKSGKFIVGYIPVCGEKEYYLACACGELYAPPGAYITLYGLKVQATFLGGVFEKIGVQPQIQRIGKYKSAGDLLSRKDMSKENCEMLTALLDNIYDNWVQKISSAQGKTKEDVENLLNEGIYKVERLKQEGWITDIKYDDEVATMLKERLDQKLDKDIRFVDYRMWREIRLLAASKPVIASMADVAASGGYYMAMGAGVIVSENLTLTGSIGVVTDEEDFFAKSAQNAYTQFRDKAAFSRSMSVDMMEAVAQGRVWSGKAAASLGLVDAIGGFSRAIAIAKQKADIPQDRKVSIVELSRSSSSLPDIISGGVRALIGLPSFRGMDGSLKELLDELSPSGVQARMDNIIFQGLGEYQDGQMLFKLIKDYLSSF